MHVNDISVDALLFRITFGRKETISVYILVERKKEINVIYRKSE